MQSRKRVDMYKQRETAYILEEEFQGCFFTLNFFFGQPFYYHSEGRHAGSIFGVNIRPNKTRGQRQGGNKTRGQQVKGATRQGGNKTGGQHNKGEKSQGGQQDKGGTMGQN